MSGQLHGQTAHSYNEAFIGLIQVVGSKSEVDFFAKSNNAGTEVDLADFSSPGLVLGLVDEPFPGINHIAKRQLTPVEGLLEIGGLEPGFDRKFTADRLLVAVDSTDSSGAQGASSGPVVHDDKTKTT